MMEQVKTLNVAIVGGGPGCKAIMDMIFTERLSELRMKLVGVACTNPKAVGYLYAQEKRVYTTQDYRDLYELKDLNMIIELTGRDEVVNEIFRSKPDHIRLMGHFATRLFWDVFRIEEERIAERKQAEDELRESEERYHTVLEASPDPVVAYDMGGRCTYINPAFTHVFGWTLEGLLGKKLDYVPDENWPETQMMIDKVQAGESFSRVESRRYTKDGNILDVSISAATHLNRDGIPVGSVNTLRDITDRKRAEEALAAERERLDVTLRSIGDGVIATDSEGRIVLLNKVAEDLTGWSHEEAVGGPLEDVFHIINEITRQRCEHPVKKVIESGKIEGLANHTVLIARDGTERILADSAAPIHGKDGKIIGVVLVFRDITEQRNIEIQFQQAQKMEAVGTLAGGIAHDFNNLLMGIQGNVSLMLMGIDTSYPSHERLKSIEKQVNNGARLTSHLLGYARKGKYEVKPLDLNQLVRETSDAFGRARKQITLNRELAEDLFAVEADQGQIEQVLLNLFVNASDAMPGGGNLTLKTMNINHKDMKGKVYEPKSGNYVLLTVTDTGTGMDKKTMERIFDPFFTTKEMGRGTGLGLASVYGIIKGHGGYLDVESKKGHGTTFLIYVPASEKRVEQVVKHAERFIQGSGTVLLVDDEEVVLEVGQSLLEAMGYRVLLARDGKEAVWAYGKNQDDIDIVLLDMVMPNMGGGEAYDRMKEINPDVKVLLSSGYSIDGEATDILERGCNGFIQKPFNMNELAKKIGEILDKK